LQILKVRYTECIIYKYLRKGLSKEEKRAAIQKRRATRKERKANRPEGLSLGEIMTNV